jgi:BirA family biotin operon repressor/biotin-[acetyl-CoA-carboxylase] ligase
MCDSTNERARELALAGAPHGTLVTAEEQAAGRGRQGRRWLAPPRTALLCSLVIRDPPALLPLLAAVAVAEVCGPEAKVKWPNDVLLDDGKVAGILIEGRPQEGWAILGIGLNVAVPLEALPQDVGARAATLGREPGEVKRALERLLDALAAWLGRDEQAVLAAFRARDALAGREVAWATGQGRAAGVDGRGRLVVELEGGGRAALAAGEVHLGGPS